MRPRTGGRSGFCAVGLLAAVATLSLSDYSERVKSEVEAQIRQTLGVNESADRLQGVVSLVTDDCFFLQGEEDAMKVLRAGGEKIAPGERVEIAGRPSLEGGRVVFVAKTVRTLSRDCLPAPMPAKGADLVFVARTDADRRRDINWRRVALSGRVIGLTESGFAMEVDGIPVTVASQALPDFMHDAERTRPPVRVVCVPELILDQSTLFGRPRDVIGVKAHISGPEDVTLVPDLRYRLNCRESLVRRAAFALIAVLGAALLVLFGFLVRQARRQLRTSTLMRERRRMADDLHDTIEQHLVGAGMLLQVGRTKEAREILVRAKREMRDIVWGLKNDDMMRLSPAEMIREYVREENRKGVTRLDAKLVGLPEHLDASQMRDLSLILREAVGNAVKHGGARKIALASDPLDGGWMLRIANDGAPYDPTKAPGAAEGHFGLEGMKARARRLGAELTIAVDRGRTVVALTCRRES